MEWCLEFARIERRLSVDRVAERMGLANKWQVYKWLESGRLPAVLIPTFELACDCPHRYLTRFLAQAGHLLAIPIPSGRQVTPVEINALQASVTHAVSSLLAFAEGQMDREHTQAALLTAMEGLAWHHQSIEKHNQPELEFDHA